MRTNRSKWLAYTVLVGLIPIFARFLVWLVTKEGTVAPFSPQDFIAFGLVLHVSNINEMEHFLTADRAWKTTMNGVSICFIAIHGVLFALTLIGGDAIDEQAIMYCVGFITAVSLMISYHLFHRIAKVLSIEEGHVS